MTSLMPSHIPYMFVFLLMSLSPVASLHTFASFSPVAGSPVAEVVAGTGGTALSFSPGSATGSLSLPSPPPSLFLSSFCVEVHFLSSSDVNEQTLVDVPTSNGGHLLTLEYGGDRAIMDGYDTCGYPAYQSLNEGLRPSVTEYNETYPNGMHYAFCVDANATIGEWTTVVNGVERGRIFKRRCGNEEEMGTPFDVQVRLLGIIGYYWVLLGALS